MNDYNLTTKKTWADTRSALEETFRLWGVNDWNIIANVTPTRASNVWQGPQERTVTLRFVHPDGQEIRLTMDRQGRAVDNLRVLWKGVEAMRMNEKRGIGDVLREAYLQLPAPPAQRDPFEVLGVRPDADREIVDAAYRTLAKRAHPDAGGSEDAMRELNDARDRAYQARGWEANGA